MFDLGLYREVFQSLNKNKLRTLLSGFTVASIDFIPGKQIGEGGKPLFKYVL